MDVTPLIKLNQIIKLHTDNGLSQDDAEKAALVTIQFAMNSFGRNSLLQKAENILLKKFNLPLVNRSW